jgi:hypothetical protein
VKEAVSSVGKLSPQSNAHDRTKVHLLVPVDDSTFMTARFDQLCLHLYLICGVCSAATVQLWKACSDDNLEGVKTVVKLTPQDQRIVLLNQGDPDDNVSLCLIFQYAISCKPSA